MKVDLLYLAKGREAFTAASTSALYSNTDEDLIDRMVVYSDGFDWGNNMPLKGLDYELRSQPLGGPVAIMNHFLAESRAEIIIKIDNDVIVPPGWLEHAIAVMEASPELGVLGLEPPASRTANPHTGKRELVIPEHGICTVNVRLATADLRIESGTVLGGYAPVDSVGGVALFRRSIFEGRPPMVPYAEGRGGFGDWQLHHRDVVKGWICPPLKLFLLDRLPFEPWLSLSKRYNAEKLQRPWTNYADTPAIAAELWGWWKR